MLLTLHLDNSYDLRTFLRSSELENQFPDLPRIRAVLSLQDYFALICLDRMKSSLEYFLAPVRVYDKMFTQEMKNLKGLWLFVDLLFFEFPYEMLATLPNQQHPKVQGLPFRFRRSFLFCWFLCRKMIFFLILLIHSTFTIILNYLHFIIWDTCKTKIS